MDRGLLLGETPEVLDGLLRQQLQDDGLLLQRLGHVDQAAQSSAWRAGKASPTWAEG